MNERDKEQEIEELRAKIDRFHETTVGKATVIFLGVFFGLLTLKFLRWIF